MATTPDEGAQPNKPGPACLGCRRRKLKCTREQEGCSNCLKADLPCVYPTLEAGVKRKRGPYKKDKAPRERHLEDLVRYLEPKDDENGTEVYASRKRSQLADSTSDAPNFSRPADGDRTGQPGQATPSSLQSIAPQHKSGNAEDLVKDALIALTKSSVNDIENNGDQGRSSTETTRQTVSLDAGLPGSHPSARRMFEYWDLFVHRVDPLMKVIHCPSFTKNLFAAVDDPKAINTQIETLLFSIYFCAVSTCSTKECRARFGESRSALLQRYGKTVEANLSDNYSMPALESLQALVLYLIAIRRDDGDVSVRALFSLAVRMAQLINLHEDPAGKYPPFEVEMRRRLWWHLCGLESRAAEEGVARQTSIMEDRDVRIASNLSDLDLRPDMKEPPAARIGPSGTSFLILRAEVVSLAHGLWSVKKKFKLEGREHESDSIQREQRALLAAFRSTLQRDLLAYCDPSRRYDWLILNFFEAMSIKMHIIVNHPHHPSPSPNSTTHRDPKSRLDLLSSSVTLIATLGISKSSALGDWAWYFRGYMQWHAVAVVIAELGRSTNRVFADQAWAVLDPVLRSWDEVFRQKRGEVAWEYVDGMIGRARGMRRKAVQGAAEVQTGEQQQAGGVPEPMAAYHLPPHSVYQASPLPSWPQPQQQYPGSADLPLTPSTLPYLPSFHTTTWQARTLQPSQQKVPPPPEAPPSIPNNALATGCVPPSMPDLSFTDINAGASGYDIADFDSLEEIDFSAFDAVFADLDGGDGFGESGSGSSGMEFNWDGDGAEGGGGGGGGGGMMGGMMGMMGEGG